jgi:hypothetical protein
MHSTVPAVSCRRCPGCSGCAMSSRPAFTCRLAEVRTMVGMATGYLRRGGVNGLKIPSSTRLTARTNLPTSSSPVWDD